MKKTNVAKAQGLEPFDQACQQDGKDAKGFESFHDGIFCVFDLSFFHFQDGFGLHLFILLDQGLQPRFGDILGQEIIFADKNGGCDQTFLRGGIQPVRQGFIQSLSIRGVEINLLDLQTGVFLVEIFQQGVCAITLGTPLLGKVG